MQEVAKIFLLSFLTFCVAMLLTPIYTHFAYRHAWWKRRRTTATTGEALTMLTKVHKRKRNVPTMAGLIVILAATIATVSYTHLTLPTILRV